MILRTFEVRNRHYSNRILIHIWSALPSLTVWSEFASDWQPALIDGSWISGPCFPPVSEIFQMPLGAPEDTVGHRGTWFFSGYLFHVLLSRYSGRFLKITFLNHICANLTYCSFNYNFEVSFFCYFILLLHYILEANLDFYFTTFIW